MGGTSDGGARIRFDRFGARQEPARVSAVAANRWAEVGREGDKDKDRRWAAAAAAATAATVALGRDRGGSAVGGGGTIPTNTTAAWSSSAGVGAGAGGAGGVVGEGGRGRGWRTEADADLSDIKATMRRIDGEQKEQDGCKQAIWKEQERARKRAHNVKDCPFHSWASGNFLLFVFVF